MWPVAPTRGTGRARSTCSYQRPMAGRRVVGALDDVQTRARWRRVKAGAADHAIRNGAYMHAGTAGRLCPRNARPCLYPPTWHLRRERGGFLSVLA